MPKAGEQIPGPKTPPKKLPDGDKKTTTIPQLAPSDPLASPGLPAAPASSAAPASPRPLNLGQSPY